MEAKTIDEKIQKLEELIKAAPKHKSSENLLKELRTRLKKLQEKKEKSKKSGKSTKKSIRKEGFQCVILGLPNSGKSSLLTKLTNAQPKISPYAFTTSQPEIGTMLYQEVKAQIIDLPSIGSENLDQGLINTADCTILVIEYLNDLEKITPYLSKNQGQKIIAINKSDLLNNEQQRKLEATIKSKKLNAILISTITNQNIELLKQRIFEQMHVMRIYTKEPGKPLSNIPFILKENSTVKDIAESILKGLSNKIKETRITGPSSKFPNQKVGLSHILKDKDIIEFRTR
ncbi:50S ribosome-binding GTPase [Candidatus Woesearchaeota archaeon]|nr:50S ribosome-binding GTPase [Candidatus Woesearchaeota archaeon]